MWCGGLLGAFYVGATIVLSPRLGAATLFGVIVAGQMATAVVLDHFGYPDPKLGLACPTFQTVLRALDNGRTWVKLSAGYRMGGAKALLPFAAKLLEVLGQLEKLN